jgi:hypothetical protein
MDAATATSTATATATSVDPARLRALSRDVLRYLFDFVAPMDDMAAFLDLPPPVARAAFTQLLFACSRSAELVDCGATYITNGHMWSFAADRGLPLALFARRYARNLPRLAAARPGCRLAIRRSAREPTTAPIYASAAGAQLHIWPATPSRSGLLRAYFCCTGPLVDRDGVAYSTITLLSSCPLNHNIDFIAANFDIECVVENTRVLRYHDTSEVLVRADAQI